MIKLMLNVLRIIPFELRTKIKYFPIIKQFQWLIINWVFKDSQFNANITAGPARGLVFPVKLPNDKLMWIGTWEVEFSRLLAKSIVSGSVCYDVGCYKGYFSGIMALNGARKVFAFEPVPENARQVEKLIKLNPMLNIELLEMAICNSEEESVFKIMQDKTMGKLEISSFQVSDESYSEFRVKCAPLDILVKGGLEIPDLIKIDVEGAEFEVLQGAIGILEKYRPQLMIEIHSTAIGVKCRELLQLYYEDIFVLETGLPPGLNEAEICHYIVH